MGCDEAAGVYLVQLDDGECSWSAKGSIAEPACARIELVEANQLGLRTAECPCSGGDCTSMMSRNPTSEEYGPSASNTINTQEDFKVSVKFFALLNADDEPVSLKKIETTLSQDGRSVTLVNDDSAFLEALTSKLTTSMAVVISNYQAGSSNEISGQCPTAQDSSEGNAFTASDFRWTIMDSIAVPEEPENPTGELVIGERADSLALCDDEFCTGCSESWYSDAPSTIIYTCTDYTRYRYNNRCRRGGALCGPDDEKCMFSYPNDDPARGRSADRGCRPLPKRLEEGEFEYGRNRCRSSNGLCYFDGCSRRSCRRSWPAGDADRWKSADYMCRCVA
mmetsp:Transcript_24764/g.30945  ORF Transcript_24764/g.30945 Transcript_24764/m.30945 type:complete len:336 (-) Transcript_24764:113-1120(-)